MVLARHLQIFVVILLPMLSMACGGGSSDRPKTVSVSGKVLYKGQPLADAGVIFLPTTPGARQAMGATDANGYYRLTTFEKHDGAVIGTHNVGFSKVNDPNRNPDGTEKYNDEHPLWTPPTSVLPEHYSNPLKSNLTREVVGGKQNVFDFELTD